MQHKKSNAFRDYPTPKSREEIQKWMGLVLFYKRWITSLSTIVAPITDLLKKSRPFKWGDAQQHAFEAVRTILTSDSVMGFPDLK